KGMSLRQESHSGGVEIFALSAILGRVERRITANYGKPGCSPSTRRGSRISGKVTFVKVDCAGRHHVALLTPDALVKAGMSLRPRFSTSKDGSVAGGAE